MLKPRFSNNDMLASFFSDIRVSRRVGDIFKGESIADEEKECPVAYCSISWRASLA
jgi:hypothetical protein